MTINQAALVKIIQGGDGLLTKRDLVRKLGLGGDERRELREMLAALIEDGTIIRTDRKTYRCADTLPSVMVLTIDHIDDQGDMVGLPGKWDGKGPAPKIIVRERSSGKKTTAKLGVGDRALCKIKQMDEGYQGEVIRILGSGPKQELGVVVKGGRGLRIRPVRKGSRYDFVPQRGAKINDQDLVLFELSKARHKGERLARVVKTVGNVDQPRAASIISLYEHNIPTGFSAEEIADAKSATMPRLDKYRKDLRDIPLLTIDPDDAKDFDDAIYAEAAPKGGFIVWVAIADVSAFVTSGSALDKGAFKRGNSTYLPDRVEPMLPEELSADLCSLRPDEDRACLAVQMRFDEDGNKTSHKFVRGLMRSHARLTYSEAQSAFDGKPVAAAQPVTDILEGIYAAYKALREARNRRAPLDIEMPERKVRVDAKGHVTSIEVKDRFDAHKLVEEFMIQANVAAAQALDRKNAPMVFRVHEPPEHERVQGLADFLPNLDLKWTLGERPTTRRFNKLLAQARGKDLTETVSMSVLRTQMKAYYTPKNGGHFGLNLTHYTHFTSPIRRYADLIVHRALIKAFDLGEDGSSGEEISRLQEISDHISETERQSMAAERDSKDRYIASYLQSRIGAEFPGRIAGVTNAGLFIALDETGADGFSPARNLGVERFMFDEKSKSLIGMETGGTYKFGRRVRVRLIEATPLTGGLLFELLTEPEKGKIPKRSHRYQSGGGYKGKRKGGKKRRR